MTHSYEPQEIQQPHGYSDIDSESNRAPAYKLPINPKHFKGRYMPPAPTTTTKKLLTKFQQRSGVTPLTDLDSLNGSSDKLITSSKVSAEQSGMSSEDDASSYAPSCTKPVPKAAAKGKPPVARPPLHPRTFTKHDPNTVQQQTTMPCAPHGAAKPSRTMNESQVLQVLYLRPFMLISSVSCDASHVKAMLLATHANGLCWTLPVVNVVPCSSRLQELLHDVCIVSSPVRPASCALLVRKAPGW